MKNQSLSAILLSFAIPHIAFAQDVVPAVVSEQDSYEALVESMIPPGGLEAAQANTLREIRAAYQQDPDFADLEQSCPGTIGVVMDTMTPILKEYDIIELRLRREAMLEILKVELSPDQARLAADFYSSPLGRKLMGAVAANHSLSNTLQSVMASEDETPLIDSETVSKDNREAAIKAVSELSPEEIQTIRSQIGEEEWYFALMATRPKMLEAAMAIANSDFAPHLDKRLDEEVEAAMTSHLETCGY
ncbi:hypothetical protein K3152_08000 [Qipengyuania sp. 1NDH17]|uniref:DUF2059 domain-containing protein n=1 Tax=Qipengyuania polymorpha TaxID=2867234 RepID=A0ABS7J141_9SPHN|nr:hypothetical protein [Qipengyuania polymorpha]MBX7458186.1 hypothetical protein [Qipengyuania polymorpha]